MNVSAATHASVTTMVTLALAEPGTTIPDGWLEASIPRTAGALAGLAAELVRTCAELMDPPRDPIELWQDWMLQHFSRTEEATG